MYRHLTLVLLMFRPISATLILVGSPLFTWYYSRLMIKPMWFGIVVDWCALAEAGLGVEAANLPSHLVNTFAMRVIFLV